MIVLVSDAEMELIWYRAVRLLWPTKCCAIQQLSNTKRSASLIFRLLRSSSKNENVPGTWWQAQNKAAFDRCISSVCSLTGCGMMYAPDGMVALPPGLLFQLPNQQRTVALLHWCLLYKNSDQTIFEWSCLARNEDLIPCEARDAHICVG